MAPTPPSPVRRARTAGAPHPTRWWSPAVLPGRWTPVLLGGIAAIVLLHLVTTTLRYSLDDFPGKDTAVRVLDVNQEAGLPAWFSTLLLFSTAVSLWLLADRSALTDRSRWVRHERGLALVFVYLSLDEATSLHEQTAAPLRDAFDLDGVLSYAWVVLFVPLVLVVAVLYLGWLRSLPLAAARLVVVAGLLYVGGAAGVEMVGAGLDDAGQKYTPGYALVVTVEELGEMLGVLLMLSVVTWLRRQPGPAGARPS